MLKNFYKKINTINTEEHKMLSMVRKYTSRNSKILDVGCGYGRYLKLLNENGYDILGVEQNLQIVEENKKNGFNCISADEFKNSAAKFDLIIFSHIIEHFAPNELLLFLESYLSKLNNGGHIIIATPLYSNYFYDDFDHIKPYHPLGIQMVFGQNQAQVKYYATHKLNICDLWFRKAPLVSTYHRAKYIKSFKTRVLQLYDTIMTICFKLTGGIIGRKDGWVGVFQKVNNA